MRFFLYLVLILYSALTILAQEEAEIWNPDSPVPEAGIDSDWVQLNHGEWLKGELVSLRDDTLIFDSNEFDVQSLDWEDVSELHSVGEVVLVLRNKEIITSRISK